MRVLVLLVAASCCTAQLLPYAAYPGSWFSTPQVDTQGKVVALPTPYIYPNHFATPYTYPYASPYAYSYGYVTQPGLKATEFPYIWQESTPEAEVKPESAPAVEEARRRRRDVEAVKVPLPYVHPVPTVTKTTFETKQFEPVDAATPADTTKLAITTKSHEVAVPAVKYVQPVLKYKPVTYKVASPIPLSYSYPTYPYYPTYPTYPYIYNHVPVIKV